MAKLNLEYCDWHVEVKPFDDGVIIHHRFKYRKGAKWQNIIIENSDVNKFIKAIKDAHKESKTDEFKELVNKRVERQFDNSDYFDFDEDDFD